MKKLHKSLLLLAFVPLLMANSPSPELYPDEYTDYEIVDESAVISEEGSAKFITFSGEIRNIGEGVINFRYSNLIYRFESKDYDIFNHNYNNIESIQGLKPNKSYIYEEKYGYDGGTAAGAVSYTIKRSELRGYSGDDIITAIAVSNLSVSHVSYNESNDETTYTISFDWNNPGEYSAETLFISFLMNDEEYLFYKWESIKREDSGHSDVYISISGDVSNQELDDLELTFIRRSYENRGWNFFGSPFFKGFMVVVIIISAMTVLGPIAVLVTLLIIARKRKTPRGGII
ncbi:MAG: hypothetical protein WC127_06400 [Acidaminococcaceae bacterium]